MTNEFLSVRNFASMFQNALQRKFIEDDYVGQAFRAQRSDKTLRVRVRQCENTYIKNTA